MSETYQASTYRDLFDASAIYALQDWLSENGETIGAEELTNCPPPKIFDSFIIGSGRGIGSGSGIGSGIGIGRGSGRGRGIGSGSGIGIGSGSGIGRGIGSGIGIGSGSGIGRGSGRGSGSGRGRGIGSGSGIGSGRGSITQEVNRMEIGKAYLIHCGDWHTFVGRVKEQTGPFTYKMESSSKMDTNQGDVWNDLCLEKNETMRRSCQYWHDRTPRLCVLSISALEWEGKTPQEAGYPGQ